MARNELHGTAKIHIRNSKSGLSRQQVRQEVISMIVNKKYSSKNDPAIKRLEERLQKI